LSEKNDSASASLSSATSASVAEGRSCAAISSATRAHVRGPAPHSRSASRVIAAPARACASLKRW